MRNHYPILFVRPSLVVAVAAIYGGALAWPALLGALTGIAPTDAVPPSRAFAAGVLVVAAFLYGFMRAVRFHPLMHVGYLGFLRTTPWTPRDPLPLAPLELVWQDVLPLAALTTAAWLGVGPEPWIVPATFAFTYLFIAAAPISAFGGLPAALVVLAGLPLVLLRELNGWPAVLVLAALYPVAVTGICAMLRRFPWEDGPERGRSSSGSAPVGDEDDAPAPAILSTFRPKPLQAAAREAGWPFGPLAPLAPPPPVKVTLAVVGSMLAGWWAFALLRLAWPAGVPPKEDARHAWLMLLVAGGGIAFVRLLRYVTGHAPPIKFAGRIATGRLIIPGYDRVLAAPLLVLLAAAELPRLLPAGRLGVPATIGLVLPVLLGMALLMGPTLARWRLTGEHRLYSLPADARATPRNAHAPRSTRGAIASGASRASG